MLVIFQLLIFKVLNDSNDQSKQNSIYNQFLLIEEEEDEDNFDNRKQGVIIKLQSMLKSVEEKQKKKVEIEQMKQKFIAKSVMIYADKNKFRQEETESNDNNSFEFILTDKILETSSERKLQVNKLEKNNLYEKLIDNLKESKYQKNSKNLINYQIIKIIQKINIKIILLSKIFLNL